MAVATLAVYKLQPKVQRQLKQIVDSKESLKDDDLKKRLAILDTRLCMAPCAFIMNDFESYKSSDKQWFSEPFYTGPRGYKLCLVVYANGYGSAHGSYVTVGVYMMWGENDDLLNWPATRRVKIEVKSSNQQYSNRTASISLSSFKSPVTSGERSNGGYGKLDYLCHKYLRYFTDSGRLKLSVTITDY